VTVARDRLAREVGVLLREHVKGRSQEGAERVWGNGCRQGAGNRTALGADGRWLPGGRKKATPQSAPETDAPSGGGGQKASPAGEPARPARPEVVPTLAGEGVRVVPGTKFLGALSEMNFDTRGERGRTADSKGKVGGGGQTPVTVGTGRWNLIWPTERKLWVQ